MPTSSVTRAGLDELALELLRRFPCGRRRPTPRAISPPLTELAEHRVFRPAQRAYRVGRMGEHSYAVSGRASSGSSRGMTSTTRMRSPISSADCAASV